MQYVAHGDFAYVNEISFAYPEHLVHGGVAFSGPFLGVPESQNHLSIEAQCDHHSWGANIKNLEINKW